MEYFFKVHFQEALWFNENRDLLRPWLYQELPLGFQAHLSGPQFTNL